MAAKKPTYIALELEFMETQIEVLKEQAFNLVNHPEDRYGPKELPNGKIVQAIISSKEDQIKTGVSILEKLPKMLFALEELRSKDELKKATRGDISTSPIEEY